MKRDTLIGRTALAIILAAGLCVAATQALAQGATPRRANGKPDLTGFWNAAVGDGIARKGDDESQYATRDGTLESFEDDGQVLARANTNRPVYKPEHWQTVRELDWNNGRQTDPAFSCIFSFPRFNQTPDAIFQTDTHIVLIYSEQNKRRVFPIDGRKHLEAREFDQTYLGDSIGTWDGDTLVIDTVGFNDVTWFKYTGYVHSNELRVTERIKRDGNVLQYDVTVTDPMLVEPWHMTSAQLRLNTNPEAQVPEEAPCQEVGGAEAAAAQPNIGR